VARNIEIKARVASVAAVLLLAHVRVSAYLDLLAPISRGIASAR